MGVGRDSEVRWEIKPVSFKYDPFGRRIYKSSTSATSIYAYDGDNLVEEANSSGTEVASYSQGLNIDEPLAMDRSSVASFYEADGLGSITSLSSGAGALAQTYTRDSFGRQTGFSGSLLNPFQYTGREADSETDLYYYRARYYEITIGRLLSEDPSSSPDLDGANMYSYVGNDPTDSVDPWGLCKILFNGTQIRIEKNDGSQQVGPFGASNLTGSCHCGIKEGVYLIDNPQWLFRNGHETRLGKLPWDKNRDKYGAFGPARIPLEVPGRTGIMIHSRHPDTGALHPTAGCIRVREAVASSFSKFFDAVCTNDGPNSFHYYRRPW